MMSEEDISELRYFLLNDSNRSKIKTLSRDTALAHDLGVNGAEVEGCIVGFLEEKFGFSYEELESVLGCSIMEYFLPEFYSMKTNVLLFSIPTLILVLSVFIIKYFLTEPYSILMIVLIVPVIFLSSHLSFDLYGRYRTKKLPRFTVGMLEDAIEEVLRRRELSGSEAKKQ